MTRAVSRARRERAAILPDLVGHDRQPAAFLVYIYLWRRTDAGREQSAAISLREVAEGTGLSKRAVQEALKRLVRRELVSVKRSSITAVGEYDVRRPWLRAGP